MDPTRFHGWTRPGPMPPGGVDLEPGETLDYLSGNFRIFQLQGGHRYSTDDLLTAWYGIEAAPRVARAADLGSGVGSVAMLVAWRLPGARVCTVEAQATSIRLARKSVQYNGLASRLALVHGDLREPTLFEAEEPFDLVTGSPPYFAPGTATPARHQQAVPARIEMRGDVGDYARTAGRLLAPGGVFACVFPCDRLARVEAALEDAGLTLLRRRDVVFREGEPARVSLLAAVRKVDVPGDLGTLVEPPLTIRLQDGRRHAEYARIRLAMGFPPGGEPDQTYDDLGTD